MRSMLLAALLSAAASAASAAPTADQVLAANAAAVHADALKGKATLKTDYAFSGMGMTGYDRMLQDVTDGRYADTYDLHAIAGGEGFDGEHAWQKEMSGTVTLQEGGDARPLAVNEAYRRANLWWRPDHGGAQVTATGRKTEGGATYDVLTVVPKDGKPFEAWFDAGSHLLMRTVETQGARTVVTAYADYRPVDGFMLAGRSTVDDGSGAKFVLTLTLTSATFLSKQDASAYAPPKVDLADFAIDGGAAETTFPFRLINNHIYAEASVDGRPFTFIFDTGGHNILTPATASAVGVKAEGAVAGHGVGEGVMDIGFGKVAELRLGHAVVKDQAFAVTALDAMNPIEGVDMPGMVGFEVFRRFVTRIDYGAGTITLIDPKRFDPKDAGTPVKFVFSDQIPQVSGGFEGVPGTFQIDTGSRAELTLTRPFVEAHGLRAGHPKGLQTVEGWGVGGPSRAYVTRGASLAIGPVEVKDVVTSLSTQTKGDFASAAYAGNIGGGVLKRFVVTFDYEHQIMFLRPLPAPVADTGQFDKAGMWFNRAADGFEIVDVTPGAPAAAAGLKAGDHILAVDGKPATSIPVYELRKALRDDPAGTKVVLKVKGAAGEREATVVLHDLI